MRSLIVAVVSVAAAPSAMAAQETTSTHVDEAVVRLGEEVDLVREEMGRPELTTDPWIVVQAEPRHAKDVDAPPIARPKHMFPSHVCRIAGMLQDELARLEARN